MNQCEQMCRIYGQEERERCDGTATHYCPECDQEVCLHHAGIHHLLMQDGHRAVRGLRPLALALGRHNK